MYRVPFGPHDINASLFPRWVVLGNPLPFGGPALVPDPDRGTGTQGEFTVPAQAGTQGRRGGRI